MSGSKTFGAGYNFPSRSASSGKEILHFDPTIKANFIDLLDTFPSYSGKAGLALIVKSTEDGITVTEGYALTRVNDTNITLTLGGTPATALLKTVSLTLGWTGTLADGRIASAANWNTAYGWGNHASAGYQPLITAGTTGQYWRGDKSWQTLNKSAVGLGAVLNVEQEPALGNPSVDGYVLSSTIAGVRSWVTKSSSVGTFPTITPTPSATQLAIWDSATSQKGSSKATFDETDFIIDGTIKCTGDIIAYSV